MPGTCYVEQGALIDFLPELLNLPHDSMLSQPTSNAAGTMASTRRSISLRASLAIAA